jgi:hypothetical protein
LATIIQVQKWLNQHFFGLTKQGAKTMDCLLELLQKGFASMDVSELKFGMLYVNTHCLQRKFYNVSNHFKMVLGLNNNAIQLLKDTK